MFGTAGHTGTILAFLDRKRFRSNSQYNQSHCRHIWKTIGVWDYK